MLTEFKINRYLRPMRFILSIKYQLKGVLHLVMQFVVKFNARTPL